MAWAAGGHAKASRPARRQQIAKELREPEDQAFLRASFFSG
jgi:hypothetical protein